MNAAVPFAEPMLRVDMAPEASRAWLRLRVQLLLARLHYSVSQLPNDGSRGSASGYFLGATCEMAMFAAKGDLNGFSSLCLLMAARIEPYNRKRHFPDEALRALSEWMFDADRYLRRPSSRVRSTSLVGRLNDPAWGHPMQEQERHQLINELVDT
jgi:hypothetical protein